MARIKFITFISIFMFGINPVFSADLLLPFSGGETWRCDQGNYNDPRNVWGNYCYTDDNGDGVKDCKKQWSNPTHRQGSNLEYAWDFNLGYGNNDLGKPVLAPGPGRVVYAKNSKSAWGNVVIIDYLDGTFGKLAHLQRIDVCEAKDVSQGQQIGTCGGTGGWASHIHYQTQSSGDLNGQSVKSKFIDAEEPDRIPKEAGLYTSLNTQNIFNNFRVGKFSEGLRIEPWGTSFGVYFSPFSRPFALTYFHEGDPIFLGHPANAVHLLNVFEAPGFNIARETPACYIQDIQNTSGGQPWLTLVLNPHVWNIRMKYLGVVYPIHGQIRNYWRNHYSDYGPPASNEYEAVLNGKKYIVQWFEKTDNNYVKITYDTVDGTFNDPDTIVLSYGEKLNQSTLKNIGCPNGVCDTGGDETILPSDPQPTSNYSVAGADTIEYVQPHSGYSGELNYRTVFPTTLEKAGYFVKLINVTGINEMKIRWRFYTPDGTIWEEKYDWLGYEERDWYIYQYTTISNANKFVGFWKAEFTIQEINMNPHEAVIVRYFEVKSPASTSILAPNELRISD